MKKSFLLSSLVMCTSLCFWGCSNDENEFVISSEKITSVEQMVTKPDSIIVPIEGNRDSLQKLKTIKTRSSFDGEDYQLLQEELTQLDEIPIYLQVQGNSDERQFLSATNKGKELTVEKFNGKSENQKFYLKIFPSVLGIPYLIYSKKTGTPIRLGAYKSNPNVKILYASQDASGSLFGASWDIKRAQYSSNSYIIENQDFPQQGNSGYWPDIYYSVITVNGSKISFSKYNKSPRQEFKIIPVEEFEVEKVEFDIDANATLTQTPKVLFSDKFTNNGPISQKHSFSITETYKETSSFNKKTSYNVNVTVESKLKVPLLIEGKITVSKSSGEEFTYGKSEEHSKTINRTVNVEVPANSMADLSFTIYTYKMDVPYIATCVGKTSGKKIKVRGIWHGVSVEASNGIVNVTPINGNPAGAKSILITNEMLKYKKTIKI
ncbi:aerolysin family beta-barrel pore-forming toxin [Prevotella melaninogenica]|uniref:aerolysin family beta-barrel pore-forming toxin n=1 Tax=Prevotella melaninogenica TaxID=28132 RepID=UPI001C5E8DE5|nr:aerolysin family beta-barrel pore-forming toxin [Prevotella melaninogenica]MBW4901356.1 aerolysin family beta-barrel pore-forming toxin [Prevotella melaninogenica]